MIKTNKDLEKTYLLDRGVLVNVRPLHSNRGSYWHVEEIDINTGKITKSLTRSLPGEAYVVRD